MTASLTLVRKVAAVAVLALATDLCVAADFDSEFRVGVGTTDNIGRTNTNQIDETIATAGFNFNAQQNSRLIKLNLRSQFDYLDYIENTYDSEWVGGLFASLAVDMIEDRLQWNVIENYGQEAQDPLEPVQPENRENLNFFTTGPTLYLLPVGRNSVQLDALYSSTNYETRDADSERFLGAIKIGREITRNAIVSLNFSGERVEFDNELIAPPFDRYESYVRYETTGSRNTVGVDLGYSRVDLEGSSGDGLVFRIDWTQRVTPNGTLNMNAGSNYSDQGNVFRYFQEVNTNVGETFEGSDATSPFRNNYFSTTYTLNTQRMTVDFQLFWNQEDYAEGSAEDRDYFRTGIRVQRNLSRDIFAGIGADFQRQDYKYADRRDDDTNIGVEIGYRFTPGLNIALQYMQFSRDSVMAGDKYSEQRWYLRVAYVPVWSRSRTNNDSF